MGGVSLDLFSAILRDSGSLIKGGMTFSRSLSSNTCWSTFSR